MGLSASNLQVRMVFRWTWHMFHALSTLMSFRTSQEFAFISCNLVCQHAWNHVYILSFNSHAKRPGALMFLTHIFIPFYWVTKRLPLKCRQAILTSVALCFITVAYNFNTPMQNIHLLIALWKSDTFSYNCPKDSWWVINRAVQANNLYFEQ